MHPVQKAIAQIQGTLGIAARHLKTGEKIRHNAETVFLTASTLKIPLLTAGGNIPGYIYTQISNDQAHLLLWSAAE